MVETFINWLAGSYLGFLVVVATLVLLAIIIIKPELITEPKWMKKNPQHPEDSTWPEVIGMMLSLVVLIIWRVVSSPFKKKGRRQYSGNPEIV